jgi:UDP-N-acetylmuramate--alanine ligase
MADTVTANPTAKPYTGTIDLSRPDFVGIGGSAMSGLAHICAARGSLVTGTDSTDSERITALKAAGCAVTIGHDAAAVANVTCVVYTAVTEHAPETSAAREHGIPVVHRAQVLHELSIDRHLIAVAGTHGKSTTTATIATALKALGEDLSYVVGADLDQPGTGAHDGKGVFFVAEADESDRSFHFLHPELAVITTLAHDHPENFDTLDSYLDAYVTFAARFAPEGTLIVNVDEDTTHHLLARVQRLRPDLRVITCGKWPTADVCIVGIEQRDWTSTAHLRLTDGTALTLHLMSPSRHHVSDAAAAVATLIATGHRPTDAAEAVSTFRGVRRRFTRAGQEAGVTVIDCYADHHREINACLQAGRSLANGGRVIALVQPSGYARVQRFGQDIGAVLAEGADATVLLDIHGAAPIPGVTRTIIGDAVIRNGGDVRFSSRRDVPELVSALARPGDVILLLGTGDVTTLAEPIITAIRSNEDAWQLIN